MTDNDHIIEEVLAEIEATRLITIEEPVFYNPDGMGPAPEESVQYRYEEVPDRQRRDEGRRRLASLNKEDVLDFSIRNCRHIPYKWTLGISGESYLPAALDTQKPIAYRHSALHLCFESKHYSLFRKSADLETTLVDIAIGDHPDILRRDAWGLLRANRLRSQSLERLASAYQNLQPSWDEQTLSQAKALMKEDFKDNALGIISQIVPLALPLTCATTWGLLALGLSNLTGADMVGAGLSAGVLLSSVPIISYIFYEPKKRDHLPSISGRHPSISPYVCNARKYEEM